MIFKKLFSFIGKTGRHLSQSVKPQRKGKAGVGRLTTFSDFLPIAIRGVSRSTCENYHTAVRSFIRFNGGSDISLSALTLSRIRLYERWLHEQGVCPNTSSCYLRSLRAIYNKAVKRRRIRDGKPFGSAFTGNDRTVKRGVEINDIQRLQALSVSETPRLALVRDLFLFSFYAMGMPFVDMAYLKKHQIKNDTLVYCRHKTGKQIRVKLEKCMLDIINRYNNPSSDYVFPILYKVSGSRIRICHYGSALNLYNRCLKQLSAKAGIKGSLTSYVARHSWASIAYERNIDLPIISKAMGHTDTKTTLIYISEIGDGRLAQANHKLLGEVLFPPLAKRCCII